MRRKSAISGLVGGTFTLALILTGAPTWLVIVAAAVGLVVLVGYWVRVAAVEQGFRDD